MLECKILGSNVSEDQWVCLGPGAKHGLRRIFDLESAEELEYTRLIRDLCSFKGPNSGFERLGIEFPALLEKPLSLKNIEHTLSKYDTPPMIQSGTEHIKEKVAKTKAPTLMV